MKPELTAKGILFLTNSNRKFKSIVRDRPFYSRFEYCIALEIVEADLLSGWSHDRIDHSLSVRNLWRKRHMLINRRTEITQDTADNLHQCLDWLLTARNTHDFKLVTTGNTARIYSNDLEFLDTAGAQPWVIDSEYLRAEINRPLDTIRLKTVNHRYRSYFKAGKVSEAQKTSLVALLSRAEDLRISPSLTRWIEHGMYYCYDYFFIDHNDMRWLTMISLIRSGIIRKTIEIIPDK